MKRIGDSIQDKVLKLIQYIKESNNIVFFGGAGVSTESGIPDFRSKDGLYNKHDVKFDKYEPEYLLSRDCLYNNPKVFYEFYRQKLDTRNIEPNITHKVLAQLETMGKLKAVVTQNIDGLHQRAGSKAVYEIHGSTQCNYCHKCKMKYHTDYLFNTNQDIPKCECGGLIRPDITLYGEKLPDKEFLNAINAVKSADLLIIGGTSLTVYPANTLLSYFDGEHIIIINKEDLFNNKSPYNLMLDISQDLVINESLGKVFSIIEDKIKSGDICEKSK